MRRKTPYGAERYSMPEVELLTGLGAARVRAWIAAGIVRPLKLGGRWRFSLNEVLVLRIGRQLMAEGVGASEVRASLVALQRRRAELGSLRGMVLVGRGGKALVEEAGHRWNPRSGQLEMPLTTTWTPQSREGASERSFSDALAHEDAGRDREAQAAYEQALVLDPGDLDAHFNLARLHLRQGRPEDASRHLGAFRDLQGRR